MATPTPSPTTTKTSRPPPLLLTPEPLPPLRPTDALAAKDFLGLPVFITDYRVFEDASLLLSLYPHPHSDADLILPSLLSPSQYQFATPLSSSPYSDGNGKWRPHPHYPTSNGTTTPTSPRIKPGRKLAPPPPPPPQKKMVSFNPEVSRFPPSPMSPLFSSYPSAGSVPMPMSPLAGRAGALAEKTVLIGECRTGLEEGVGMRALEGVYSVRTGNMTRHFRRKSKTD